MKILTRHEEIVLLTILRLKDKAYLVTIKDMIKKYMDRDQSFGTLYVSLKRLKRYGYLSESVGAPTAKRGGKAVKYYRLTRDGITALKTIRKLHNAIWDDFSEIADEYTETL
ncbi:PadR family transcriptional regulator [candidate division KSB1 bacterium]